MSNSQNTKNEHQKDLCITSEQLTEQWKKGELKLGKHYYYTTIFSPTVYIQNFTRDVVSFQDFKETVAEVLAPVPSYSEYIALQSDGLAKNEAVEINAELEAENAKLKELLNKIKTQCELIVPKNGLSPVGDRAMLCKVFLNLIDEVIK